jgi:hypothetical protein
MRSHRLGQPFGRQPRQLPYASSLTAFASQHDSHATGFGAGDSRGHGGFLYCAAFHLLLGRVYDDKDVQERIVRRSKFEWVIVRPVILTDGPKTNAYRALADPRDWTCGFISRADVADFLIKQIDDDVFLHKTPVLMS